MRSSVMPAVSLSRILAPCGAALLMLDRAALLAIGLVVIALQWRE